MSKELEAFKKIVQEANECGMWHCASEISIVEQALTPPTEQEVCKAMSEWVSDDFYYDVNQKEFYTKALNGQHSVVKLKNNEIHFGGWFIIPPHLITLIGRFYEGKVKDE